MISKIDCFLFKLIVFIKNKRVEEPSWNVLFQWKFYPIFFIFYYDIYEKALNSLVYKRWIEGIWSVFTSLDFRELHASQAYNFFKKYTQVFLLKSSINVIKCLLPPCVGISIKHRSKWTISNSFLTSKTFWLQNILCASFQSHMSHIFHLEYS